jgi:hypothetical protein
MVEVRTTRHAETGAAAAARAAGRLALAGLVRWLVVALVVVLVVAGCGKDRSAAPSPLAAAEDPGVVHVHGLGINPRDGRLYAATHTGLFVIADGTATRVSDRLQDTMGFTVVGSDQFLGSGHPDFRDTQLYDPARRPAAAGGQNHCRVRPTSTICRWRTAASTAMTPPASGS